MWTVKGPTGQTTGSPCSTHGFDSITGTVYYLSRDNIISHNFHCVCLSSQVLVSVEVLLMPVFHLRLCGCAVHESFVVFFER